MKTLFRVFHHGTKNEVDLEELWDEINEDRDHWAKCLWHNGLRGWVIDQQGQLVLVDLNWKYAYSPEGLYEYRFIEEVQHGNDKD